MKTYKDIYKFPLHVNHGWVWDSKDQFVFQFEFFDKEKQQLAVDVINNTKNLSNPDLKFEHKEGHILDLEGNPYILIRGWGNLTGTGGHNLKAEEAANIQDTFAEYIVERLNTRT